MSVEHLSFIAAVALGLIFLASGLSKLQDPKGFVLGVLEYEVLPPRLAIIYGRILPIVEVVTGLALVLGIWPSAAGLLSAALLLSFLVAVIINLARGRRLDCHCFGSRGEPLGWVAVARLCILLTFTAAVLLWRGDAFLASVPADLVPALLLALGIFVSVSLLSAFPTVWQIWQLKVVQGTTVSSGHIRLRDLPVDRRVPTSVVESSDGAGSGA